MKIALVSSTPVPHVYGGMDRLLEGLSGALRQRHPTDLVTLPVDERTADGVVKGYYEFNKLDLSAYDIVISYKAPAYMVSHPVQVLYLSHRLRVFYDLYEPRDAYHARMRRLIQWMDNWAMDPERIPHVFTIGRTVSRRLLKWGGIASTPIHHPTTFVPVAPQTGEYFFTVGRLHAWKRFDLIIRAMKASKADIPLLIAGTGPHEEQLKALAGGDPRIRFLGHVDEATLQRAYARSLATIFPPINEDLGMVTWEAFLSGKPVLTTTDSGEPAEIVEDGKTGFVTEPTPEAMAARLDWMAAHPGETAAMEEACLGRVKEVTWERLVDRLLAAADKTREGRAGKLVAIGGGKVQSIAEDNKIHLLVTDNQIIDPPLGGGRIRIWELYRNLPDDFVTTYVGTHDHPGPLFRDQWLAPNFREVIMPLTIVHFKMHEVWRRLTGGDATVDVTIPLLLGRCSPRYRSLIGQFLPWAHLLICAHPWMFSFLPPSNGLPRIYDSQNCEAAVKGSLLRRTLAGRYLARRVERTERLAATGARLTLACSEADAAEFSRRYGLAPAQVALTPNGVSCGRIQPGRAADKPALRRRLGLPEAPLALFVGSNYEPNLEAADWIIRHLAGELPTLFFAIVGGAGKMWQERYPGQPLPENVRLFGFVEEAQLLQLYQAADFGLNPMARGSGTNIKMLDYMAAGLPIVTSEVGARGLAGQEDVHWIQAPLEGLAPALRKLMLAPEAAQRLGTAARKLAEQQYDWPMISARLAETLRPLVAQPVNKKMVAVLP